MSAGGSASEHVRKAASPGGEMDSGNCRSASAPDLGAWANVEGKQRFRHAIALRPVRVAASDCVCGHFSRRFLNIVHVHNACHISCPEHGDFSVLVAKGRRITAEPRTVEVVAESDARGPRQPGAATGKLRISPRCAPLMAVAEVATARRNSCGKEASRMRDASG